MPTLTLVMMALVFATGLGLIATGVWYQVHRDRLQSDPVLIQSCYLWGAVLVITNLAIPALR